MTEPDPETMPIAELMELYEKRVAEFKKRNKNINYLVDSRQATTLDQKAQGRTARQKMMGEAQAEIRRLGLIVKRRLASAADDVAQAGRQLHED